MSVIKNVFIIVNSAGVPVGNESYTRKSRAQEAADEWNSQEGNYDEFQVETLVLVRGLVEVDPEDVEDKVVHECDMFDGVRFLTVDTDFPENR